MVRPAMILSLLLTIALGVDAGQGPPPPELAGADAQVSALPTNLLRSARILRMDGCPNAARIANGVASTDGDVWDSPQAALLAAGGVVEWDLGRVERVAVMRIQADNNDRYLLSSSLDGNNWAPLWTAMPVELPGVQTRTAPEFSSPRLVRYLRLTAEGGDSMYSVAELELFDSAGALAAAQLERIAPPLPPPPPPPPPFDTGLLVVGLVTAGLVGYFVWAKAQKTPPPSPPPTAG